MSGTKKDANKPIIKGNKRALFKAFEIEQDKDECTVDEYTEKKCYADEECSNIKDFSKKSKILMAPIGKDNVVAKNYFLSELKTDKLPMRWSTTDRGIPYDTEYIGFAYYIKKDGDLLAVLAIYYILQIVPPGFMYRKEWEGDVHRRRQTVLIGDLKNIMLYKTYCDNSLNKDGNNYSSDSLPRLNQLRSISHELLEMIDKSITDTNYLFGDSNIGIGTINKNRQSVTNRIKNYIKPAAGDRYEISFKEFIDGEFAEIGFIHNKRVDLSNGRNRRPDFHKKFKYMTIIIEYDERNHTDRDIDDEIKRMNQLRDHFRPTKTTIIRYGNKFNSWDAAKKCVLCIMKTIYLAMNGDKEMCEIFNEYKEKSDKAPKQIPIQKNKVYKAKTTDEITDISVEEVEVDDEYDLDSAPNLYDESNPDKKEASVDNSDTYTTTLVDKIILFGYPNNPYGNLEDWVVEVE